MLGKPSDKLSKSCNNLIKSKKAHLLNFAADLVYLLNSQQDEEAKSVQKQLFIDLDEEENNVFTFLQEKGKPS